MSELVNPLFKQVITESPGAPAEEAPPASLESPALPQPPEIEIQPKRHGPKRKLLGWLLSMAALAALAAGVAIWRASHRQGSRPEGSAGGARTAVAERRDFVSTLRLTGTVQALQSYTIAAPRLSGQQIGQLTLTKLTPAGTKVKQGDLLVEFDRQDQITNSMDRKADYLGFVQQIDKKRADQAAALAKDQTALKTAEDALETAKLEMRKNEVIDRIDAEKNKENLEEAEATLKQLRATFELKRRAAEADVKILEIQRDRSRAAMLYADRNAERMAIRSPLDGLVVLNTIWMNGQMREVQEGDQVRPGVPFMQVVNPDRMEARGRANQADVRYLRAGAPVQLRLDAYPNLLFTGQIERIAAIGQPSEMSDKVHYFPIEVSVRGGDPRLMPDLSAAIDVEIERIPNSLVIPRDALLTENGQLYVRVKNGTSFEKRRVKIGPISELDAVVESGVATGDVVLRGS